MAEVFKRGVNSLASIFAEFISVLQATSLRKGVVRAGASAMEIVLDEGVFSLNVEVSDCVGESEVLALLFSVFPRGTGFTSGDIMS